MSRPDPLSHLLTRGLGMLLVAACVFALLALPATRAAAETEEDGEEPCLVLPGGCEVTPGRTIELSWTRADAISEMEILLSVDGGRHYDVWVSPRLDPGQRCFRWRVPNLPGRGVRLRIRYNRHGREIEGPPTADVAGSPGADGRPQPLALPPFEGTGGGARSSGSSPRAVGALEEATEGTIEPLAPRECIALVSRARAERPSVARRRPPRFARPSLTGQSPRFVPLRT